MGREKRNKKESWERGREEKRKEKREGERRQGRRGLGLRKRIWKEFLRFLSDPRDH
jgi:hypothetical protein